MNKEEDLRMVKVQVATCPKCGGAIKVAVKHTMDKYTIKEFADLMKKGCDIHTTNVIVARTIRWCEDSCDGVRSNSKNKNE
jgi:hypothetical protein